MVKASPDGNFNPEHFTRQQTYLYYLLGVLVSPRRYLAARRNPNKQFVFSSVPVTVPLIFSLIITDVVLLVRLLTVPGVDWSLLWILYTGLMIFIGLYVPELIIRRVFDFINAYNDDGWNQLWKSKALWEEAANFKARGNFLEGLSALGLGAVSFVIFEILFQQTFGHWAFSLTDIPMLAMVVFLGAIWGDGGVVSLFSSYAFTRYFDQRRSQLPLYSIKPQKSVVIDRLSRIFETVLFSSSIALVFMLIGMMFTRQTPMIFWLESLVAVIGFGMLIIIFVFAQIILHRIVSKRQADVVEKLQREIEQRYQTLQWNPLDRNKIGEMKDLADLHDKLIDSGGWGIITTRLVYYLRSFVLPIITIILSRTDPKGLVDAINKLLNGGA